MVASSAVVPVRKMGIAKLKVFRDECVLSCRLYMSFRYIESIKTYLVRETARLQLISLTL